MVEDWRVYADLAGWLHNKTLCAKQWREHHPEYSGEWKKAHPEAHARHVATYRKKNPEKTLAQWAKDSKAYAERVGHDIIRERNRKAVNAYAARKRAEKALLCGIRLKSPQKKKPDSGISPE